MRMLRLQAGGTSHDVEVVRVQERQVVEAHERLDGVLLEPRDHLCSSPPAEPLGELSRGLEKLRIPRRSPANSSPSVAPGRRRSARSGPPRSSPPSRPPGPRLRRSSVATRSWARIVPSRSLMICCCLPPSSLPSGSICSASQRARSHHRSGQTTPSRKSLSRMTLPRKPSLPRRSRRCSKLVHPLDQMVLPPGPLDGLFERLALEQHGLVGVDDPERRVQRQLVEVLRDDSLAERVDRADVRALEQDQLAEQPRVARSAGTPREVAGRCGRASARRPPP